MAAVAVSCFRNVAEKLFEKSVVEYLQRLPHSLGLVREQSRSHQEKKERTHGKKKKGRSV